MKEIERLRHCKCKICNKISYQRRILLFFRRPGWLCTRCKQWWAD